MSLLQFYMWQRNSLVGPPGQSFYSLLSFLADSIAFSIYAVSDISPYSQGPNYFSIWPACHQLLQLLSSLAEFPRMPPSILNSFPLVSEEKESSSFREFCWISPFPYPPGIDPITLSLHLVHFKLYLSTHPFSLVLKCLTFPCKTNISCDLLPLILRSHLFLLFSTSLLNRQLCIWGPHSLLGSSVSSLCGLAPTFSILFNCQAVDDFPMAKDKSCYFFSLLICHHWFFTPSELSSNLLLCLLGFFFHIFAPSSSRSQAFMSFPHLPTKFRCSPKPSYFSYTHSPRHSLP